MKKKRELLPGEKNWLRFARAYDKSRAGERRAWERKMAPHYKWLAQRQAETDKFYRHEGIAFRRGWEIALWDVIIRSNGDPLPQWARAALVEYARRLAPDLQRRGGMGRKARYKETQMQVNADVRILFLMKHYIEDYGYTKEKARARVAEEAHLSEGGVEKMYARAKQLMKSKDFYYSSILDSAN